MGSMKINKIIIGVGGNIYSENGSHPIEVCKKGINALVDYSIKVEKQFYNLIVEILKIIKNK